MQNFEKLQKIIEGDGSEIKQQLIIAGLFIMIFERFKEYIENQVNSFYSSNLHIANGKTTFEIDEKYRELIKKHGKGKQGQHKNQKFRTGLWWFLDNNVINQDEFDKIEKYYLKRNEIGHELYLIIADDKKDYLTIDDIHFVVLLYNKITKWWITEIDIPTNPDFDYENADLDGVQSVEVYLLIEITKKALLNINTGI